MEQQAQARNAKYGPYLQIRDYLGLYFAVFTVKKANLAAPKFVFDVPDPPGHAQHVCGAACACPYKHQNREGGNALCVTLTSEADREQQVGAFQL